MSTRINRNTRTKAAAAAEATVVFPTKAEINALQNGTHVGLVSGTAAIADNGLKAITKVDDHEARLADSDTRTGHALAQEVIAEVQNHAKGQWLRFVAKLVPMVPKARAAFMAALREHRDATKAQAKAIGTKVAENAANTINAWTSYMSTIAQALNAGLSVDVVTDADGQPKHDNGGTLVLAQPFTHILAEARVFREAHAAQVTEGKVQGMVAAGIEAEKARAYLAAEAAAKRGRKATPFAQFCVEQATKRGANAEDLRAAAAALLALADKA